MPGRTRRIINSGPKQKTGRLLLIGLLLVVVGAHLAMWTSDMPRPLALKLTILNAVAWAVVLIPAWAVGKWAAAYSQKMSGK